MKRFFIQNKFIILPLILALGLALFTSVVAYDRKYYSAIIGIAMFFILPFYIIKINNVKTNKIREMGENNTNDVPTGEADDYKSLQTFRNKINIVVLVPMLALFSAAFAAMASLILLLTQYREFPIEFYNTLLIVIIGIDIIVAVVFIIIIRKQ